jgi:penicillin amidase
LKKLKKLGRILLVLIGILAIAVLFIRQSLKPEYSGTKQLPGLSSEVKVLYDSYGIPHIYGASEIDAFRALGYVHAQDRLWQMELLRRVAVGGLSEVFGQDLVKTDQFFLSLGIDDASVKTVSELDATSAPMRLSQAYIEGINQFIEEGPTPVEFYLTGLDKTPFEMKDVYNAVGYMAFSFAMAHKTDPLLTIIKDSLGPAYLEDLEIGVAADTEWIKNYPKTNTGGSEQIISEVTAALEKLPLPQFIGSNSWVLSAGKTKNGSVILANDPHIGFAQPSVWYEAHISTPTYEKYGYHLAGVPFPLLAHNRKVAYGFTMFENDDIDFFYETLHPTDSTLYKTPEGYKKFEVVSRTIKVKDAEEVPFTYLKTVRGPVFNKIPNVAIGDRPISMSWIYTKLDNKVIDALYGISHASNIEEFSAALPNVHAPGLNTMYGDAEGNIAWWASGTLYELGDSTHTKFVMDGSKAQDRIKRYLDFSQNPQAINPPWEYVYSANNQPDTIAGMSYPYPGYYLPENRAKRIVSLLESKDDWDADAVRTMITDGVSSVNPTLITNLAKLITIKDITDQQALTLDHLSTWEGEYELNNTEAAIFHRWIYYLLKNTFEDELGPSLFKQFTSTHFHKRLIARMTTKPTSVWWDNVTTDELEESQKDIVQKSFIQAFESLQKDYGSNISNWTWDKIHTLEHEHPIGQVAMFRSFFNVGPFPINGSREVINNMAFSYNGESSFNVTAGPSTRRVIDFSDIENSTSILPTGQSGNPFSKYYEDQAKMFAKGEFRKMLINKEEIEKTSASTLRFQAPKK